MVPKDCWLSSPCVQISTYRRTLCIFCPKMHNCNDEEHNRLRVVLCSLIGVPWLSGTKARLLVRMSGRKPILSTNYLGMQFRCVSEMAVSFERYPLFLDVPDVQGRCQKARVSKKI